MKRQPLLIPFLELLECGEKLDSHEVQTRFGNPLSSVRKMFERLLHEVPHSVHVSEWRRTAGSLRPVLAIGNKPDAQRPPKTNQAERHRAYRKHRAELKLSASQDEMFDVEQSRRDLEKTIASGHIPHDPIVLALLRPRNEARDDYEQCDQESERLSF